MKRLFTLLVCCLPVWAMAQVYNAGATMKISSGAVLHSAGDVTNTGTGTITNEGTLSTEGDITNSGTATLEGDGQYTLEGDWTNSATFTAGMSTVTFEGSTDSNIDAGGDDLYNLELNKTSADLVLGSDVTVNNNLNFASDGNQLILGAFNLILGSSATVTGDDENDFIVTGGSGMVQKNGIGTTPFLFCIGFDENTPTPVTIVQSGSGTVDNFNVRVLEHALEDGGSGAIITEDVVDVSWEITEDTPGGSDITLTTQWSASDELTGFDRTDSGVSYHTGSYWDLLNSDVGAASGSDPYTHQRTGVSDLGYFAVGGEAVMDYVAVNPKAFLQGPYSGTKMNDDLRTAMLIPTAEPYTALTGFTHVGRGGGETVDASVFDDNPSDDDDIVDWMFLELRDKTTPATVLQSRSVLIQRDGDIVDLDGTSAVKFRGMEGDDYYLAVRQRNHLGICSDAALTLSRTPISIDFTDNATATYGTNAQEDLGGGVMGMWAGNVVQDGKLKYTGTQNDRGPILVAIGGIVETSTISGYYPEDVNLNGIVKYTGSANDRAVILVNIGGLIETATLLEQLP